MTGYGPIENKINISHGTKWDQYVKPIGHFSRMGKGGEKCWQSYKEKGRQWEPRGWDHLKIHTVFTKMLVKRTKSA